MANRSKMVVPVYTIKQVRDNIKSMIDHKVRVVNNLSRKQRPVEGIVVAAYENIFAVQTEEHGLRSKKTYPYSEVITNAISVDLID